MSRIKRSDKSCFGEVLVNNNPIPRHELLVAVAGLIAAPILLGLLSAVAPYVHVGVGAIDLVTFGGATSLVLLSLGLQSVGKFPRPAWWTVAILAAACLIAIAVSGLKSTAAAVAVSASLLALGHAIGSTVGSRIEHPGHLLPACVVAGCVDIVSVIHPSGPSHAVVESQRALDLLTVGFPVLGTAVVAPAIGVGDVVFIALILGTAARHGISRWRVVILCAAAIAASGVASALLERAVPALPAIGFATVLGIGPARRLAPKDRKVAAVFMFGAVVLAVGTVVSRFVGSP